jgi:PucR family transcriptional regulator, purine catabolism regulatory protein
MRDLHARMLAALLGGEGLRGIAELAAEEAGGPVAIVLPARGLADASSGEIALERLSSFAAERLRGRAPQMPDEVELEHEVNAGELTIGYVLALRSSSNGLPAVAVDREEVLRTTALAALAEVAVSEARDEVADEVRGSLLEDLRAGRVDGDEVARRAARLGCDLSHGAVAVVAEVRSARPRHAAALISSEHEGAIAEPIGERIYAILPARAGDERPERTQASARSLAARLRPHGPAAYSSFCASPGDLGRAVAEAELMLEVIAADGRMADQLEQGIGNGVYRLLFRAMATDPDEVRRFYEDTVEPLVSHDREYRTDLLSTVESYLANDCNMNATARAVYAHRHTVAHRLGRVKELTDLDPTLGEDRERLGLGIKAYRIIAPTLPR